MDGYIKIYRSLTEDLLWQTSTPEQKVVLLTILMMVNHKEKEWEWKGKKFVCSPGQRVTSIEKIKALCGKGVSEQNIRTALVRFEKHGFLKTESTKTGRLITVANWAKYQGCEEQPNKQTNSQLTKTSQTPNKDLTTNKNDSNDKNEKNEKKERNKNSIPPTVNEVKTYCLERKNGIDAEYFVDYYTTKDWKVGKDKMRDWQAAVRTWESRNKNKQPSSTAHLFEKAVNRNTEDDFFFVED